MVGKEKSKDSATESKSNNIPDPFSLNLTTSVASWKRLKPCLFCKDIVFVSTSGIIILLFTVISPMSFSLKVVFFTTRFSEISVDPVIRAPKLLKFNKLKFPNL